jgi:hypothetical protein
VDLDEFSELESRLVGVVSRPILGEVSVGNHRVRASDFNFRYAAHSTPQHRFYHSRTRMN